MLAGVLMIGKRLWDYFGRGHVLEPYDYPEYDALDYYFFLVPVLVLGVLVGLYSHFGKHINWLGRGGLGAAMFGSTFWAFGTYWAARFSGPMGLVGAVGALLLSIGLILFGNTLRRRHVFPR